MSGILQHIKGIANENPENASDNASDNAFDNAPRAAFDPISDTVPPIVTDTTRPDSLIADGRVVPWLWILAWLIGWALVLALGAWLIGGDAMRGGAAWIWAMLWAVPGLAVAALLVRAAASALEYTTALSRLSSARTEISALETQLQTSTQSLFAATRTLSDATEILLEQVDTSRDDLRNQISSAQSLADTLRTQTEGLVTARTTYLQGLKSDVAPQPQDSPSVPADRPPPLRLRPAPQSQDVFIPLKPRQEATPAPTPEPEPAPSTPAPSAHAPSAPASTASASTAPSETWSWKDMLSNVDAATPAQNPDEAVVAMLKAQNLSPLVLIDDGNAMDALDTWDATGLPAMGQLLSIRFDEAAKVFRRHIDADPDAKSAVLRFSEARASRLSTVDRAAREADAGTEQGRAWLFTQAVLAL